MKGMFKSWEDQNPGVTVQGEFSGWEEYWTKVQTLVAAGSAPDVGIASCVYPVTYAKQGAVLPLDDLIARDSYSLDAFIPAGVDLYRWQDGDFDSGGQGGKVYGLPGDAQGYIFVYNKTLFDAAGQAYPTADWTWDDVVTAAQNLTKADEDRWGCYAPSFGSMCVEGEFVYSTGGNIISSDYKKSALDSPETMSAFKWAWDLIYTHKVAPQPVPSEPANPFASGRVAMAWEGVWALADFANITDFEWDMALHPKNPTTGKRTMMLQSDGWWMFKGTEGHGSGLELPQVPCQRGGSAAIRGTGLHHSAIDPIGRRGMVQQEAARESAQGPRGRYSPTRGRSVTPITRGSL